MQFMPEIITLSFVKYDPSECTNPYYIFIKKASGTGRHHQFQNKSCRVNLNCDLNIFCPNSCPVEVKLHLKKPLSSIHPQRQAILLVAFYGHAPLQYLYKQFPAFQNTLIANHHPYNVYYPAKPH